MENTAYCNSLTATCTVNEIFASIKFTHMFKNNLAPTPIDCAVIFFLQDDAIFKNFHAVIEQRLEIKSKVIPKDLYVQNFGDVDIPTGYSCLVNFYCLKIGELKPDETLIFEYEILFPTFFDMEDGYNFTFSPANFPYIINPSEMTKYNYPKTVNLSFEVLSLDGTPITKFVSSPCYKITPNFSNKKDKITFQVSESSLTENNFGAIDVFFKNESMREINLFEQYDPVGDCYTYYLSLNVSMCSLNLIEMFSGIYKEGGDKYIQIKNEDDELSRGMFIFVLDQSGSMTGAPIKIARDSVRLFLRSLPEGSWLDLIGFGTTYIPYTPSPLFINQSNISKGDKIIAELDATLGGTNIYDPLQYIFAKNYDSTAANLAKNIFIVTDGYVEEPEKCYDLIQKNIYRVHSIGIGSSVDIRLVEGLGKSGNGSYIYSTQERNLGTLVIRALKRAMQPYLKQVSIEVNDREIGSNMIMNYPYMKSMIYDGERMIYSFITKKRLSDDAYVYMKMFDSRNQNISELSLSLYNNVDVNYNRLDDGVEMSRLIAYQKIKHENGLMSDHEILNAAIAFQVLCPVTTLFATETNENRPLKVEKFVYQAVQSEYNADYINEGGFDMNDFAFKDNSIDIISYTAPRPIQEFDAGDAPPVDENLYHGLIFSQKVDGRWTEKDDNGEINPYVAQVLDEYATQANNRYNEIKYSVKAEMLQDSVITIVVIAYINDKFPSKKNEFEIIEKKARKFLRSCELDPNLLLSEVGVNVQVRYI